MADGKVDGTSGADTIVSGYVDGDGDTAGTGGKPATLSSGAVVRVPLFVQQGEVVRVDTRTGEYVSRVKD